MISRALPLVPAAPDALFFCSAFRCSLRGAVCLQRQQTRLPARGSVKGGPPPRFRPCGEGKCQQGAKVAKALKGHKPGAVIVSDWSGIGVYDRMTRAQRKPGTRIVKPPLPDRQCVKCAAMFGPEKDECRRNFLRRQTCGVKCWLVLRREIARRAGLGAAAKARIVITPVPCVICGRLREVRPRVSVARYSRQEACGDRSCVWALRRRRAKGAA